jgi:carbon monoxide dehydrogenase subunit G
LGVDIAGDYLFEAPRDMVWEALLDPNVLGSIMPGGKGFEQTGDNQYSGVLEVKVGPVQGTFQGQIQLSDIIAPESYHIVVDGKGATGYVKGSGSLKLEARDQQTHMQYSGQAQVGGRIASVGQRLIDSAARSIIRQSLDALNAYLQVKVAQQSPPPVSVEAVVSEVLPASAPSEQVVTPSVKEYKAPSQAGLALNVARDVFNDIIPPRYQPWFFGAIIAVVILIILLASRG